MTFATKGKLLIKIMDQQLKEQIRWSLTKPPPIQKIEGITKKAQRKQRESEEKAWGNKMIGQVDNGQWTTKLGEGMVYKILKLMGKNPRKVVKKGGFEPDWEADDEIWEVKTSNGNVSGTAGEKVLGTWIKYQAIPELYGKPLKIVCVAYQEEELTNGKTKYFGDDITDKTKKILELAKSWNIEYVAFSDLIKDLDYE